MKKLVWALLSWMSANAMAQSSLEEAKLYKVELIVFERLVSDKTFDAEKWPTALDLAYPLNWQRLVDPAREAERIERLLEERARTEALTLPDNFVRVFNGSEANIDADEPPSEQLDDKLSQEPSGDIVDQPDEAQTLPKLYHFLEERDRDLGAAERGLARSNSLRTLFHQAWIQPMLDREQAPALLIQGGNLYGNHHELEGSFTLSVARYLHLQTNLWFSQFVPNIGQQLDEWYYIPQRPDLILNSSRKATIADNTFRIEPDLSGFRTELSLSEAVHFGISKPEEKQPYLVQQVITLEQKRRMRSGELHYLDHPRIGMLIKITPFESQKDKQDAS